MREVAILGIGQTPVREHWNQSLRDLAVEAGRAAMADAGIDRLDALYVSNMNSDRLSGQRQLGALVADHLGQWGVEAVKLEAACGSAASPISSPFVSRSIATATVQSVMPMRIDARPSNRVRPNRCDRNTPAAANARPTSAAESSNSTAK